MAILIPGSDPVGNPLTLRIVSQPAHGAVAISNAIATFIPEPGFVGSDSFTFAAWNNWVDSNLGTGTVTVAQGPFAIGAVTHVPPNYPARWPAAFGVVPAVTNHAAPVVYEWDFGDNSLPDTNQHAVHAYAAPGTYQWKVVSRVSTASVTNSGSIVIDEPVQLSVALSAGQVTLSWPNTIADTLLEGSVGLGPSASWSWVTNTPLVGLSRISLTLPATGNEFFRVRRPW